MSQAQAEIFDRGYRTYDGPRTGILAAMGSVIVASVQRALGMRRKFRFKIVPILVIIVAFLPPLFYVLFAVVSGAELAVDPEGYLSFFGSSAMAVMLFSAFVAPELVISDRRSGLFGLYLASPLNRIHYVLAKFAALILVMMIVTFLPVVFALIGNTIAGVGPQGFTATLKLISYIVLAGVATAVFFALLGLAASTLTDRQGFASAGIVMALVGSVFLSEQLYGAAPDRAWVQLLSLPGIAYDLAARIFGEESEQFEGVSGWLTAGVWLAVVAVLAAIVVWGFRRMQVTK